MQTTESLRVAVVGGGLCGLACAIALLKEKVDVEVYEAAARFSEIGAGIGQGPNALRIMDALGVLEDIRSRTEEDSAQADHSPDDHYHNFHKTSGWFKFVSGLPGHEVVLDYKSSEKVEPGVHRAVLLDVLAHHVPAERIHFHKRCSRIAQSTPTDPVTMYFQDGTIATADVVLGADGIKSVVRRFLTNSYGEEHDPHLKFSKNVVYRTIIPTEKAEDAGVQTDFQERPISFVGKNKHVIVFAIRGGTQLNVVAAGDVPALATDSGRFPPASNEVSAQVPMSEMLRAYEGWGPDVLNLLACADGVSKWNINVVYPHLRPDQWARGRVAILGDAAHAMLPNLGAGAGQGFEDAYLLGKLLGDPRTTKANVEHVLRAYATVRQPRAQKVWEESQRVADIYDGHVEYDGIDGDELHALWAYVWNHGLNEDFDKAKDMLTAEGIF